MSNRNGKKKEGKTIDLAKVINSERGKFISFDNSIKSITITREFESKGETISQTLDVMVNDAGYLVPVNLETPEERAEFRFEKGWINEEQADKLINMSEKYNIVQFLTVKVE